MKAQCQCRPFPLIFLPLDNGANRGVGPGWLAGSDDGKIIGGRGRLGPNIVGKAAIGEGKQGSRRPAGCPPGFVVESPAASLRLHNFPPTNPGKVLSYVLIIQCCAANGLKAGMRG